MKKTILAVLALPVLLPLGVHWATNASPQQIMAHGQQESAERGGGESVSTGRRIGRSALRPEAIQAALDAALKKYKDNSDGKNADYIPALAKVDSKLFGLAIVTCDGKLYTAGDVKTEVSIQSISKVFTMAKVIEESGPGQIFDHIGVDATGMRFNSIVAVEMANKFFGAPEMNALVNPGAIAATSMVKGGSREAVWNSLLSFYSDFAGRPLSVNGEVFKSEADTNHRNQAIGALMAAYGYIKTDHQQATDVYTEQCSINVSTKDLAVMAATLANGGTNPISHKAVLSVANVPGILAVMAIAGLYDDSGKWLFRTGLPAKSGVGGGILAVAPGKFGIAVISPPLDEAGNRVRAQLAIRSQTSSRPSTQTPTRSSPSKKQVAGREALSGLSRRCVDVAAAVRAVVRCTG